MDFRGKWGPNMDPEIKKNQENAFQKNDKKTINFKISFCWDLVRFWSHFREAGTFKT